MNFSYFQFDIFNKVLKLITLSFLFPYIIIIAAESTMEFNGTTTVFNGITVTFSTGTFTGSGDGSTMDLFDNHPYGTPINGGNDYKDISISPATYIARVRVAWGVNVAGFILQFRNSNTVVKELTNFNSGGDIMSSTEFTVNTVVDKIRFLDAGVSNSGGFELSHIIFDQALPVELIGLNANIIESNVILNWKTASEVNNYGFEIERIEMLNVINKKWGKIGFVEGQGNSNSENEYSFEDKNINEGKYSYRLKLIYNDGNYKYSKEVEVILNNRPNKFELKQNYPNPFNPITKIRYSISSVGTSLMKFVQLKVYDILGNEVATLVNEEKPAGNYEIEFNASSLPSGIYFYKLITNGFNSVRKMLLLK